MAEPQPTDPSLRDFVASRVSDIAAQKAAAERAISDQQEAQFVLFNQKTALLKAHLQRLEKPVFETFYRFGVLEKLEEARELLNNHSFDQPGNKLIGALSGGTLNYRLLEFRPRLYDHVVTDPKPSDSEFRVGLDLRDESAKYHKIKMGCPSYEIALWNPPPKYKIEYLADPANFERLIKTFADGFERDDEYGLALQASHQWSLLVHPSRNLIWASNQHSSGWSVGAGTIYRDGPWQYAYSDEKPPYYVNVRVIKTLSVTTRSADKLMYRHTLKRVDTRRSDHKDDQSMSITLTSQTIDVNDPANRLSELIGNDVASEISDGYTDELYRFIRKEKYSS